MPRGLEALIPKKKKIKEPRKKESIFWIEIDKIKPNPFQPRKEIKKEELKELAMSIEKYGILHPLIVKRIERDTRQGRKVEYQLLAGERRLKAAKMIKMREVPVIIGKVKKEEELPLSLVENLQRKDLNSIEKARAFKKLISKFDLTQRKIGKIIGKSRESVANTLRLLSLPKEIQKSIEEGKISEGHAKALLAIKKEKQSEVFKEILRKKLSVREVEKRKKRERKDLPQLKEKILKTFQLKNIIKNIKVEKINSKIKIIFVFKNEKDLKEFLRKFKSL